MGSDEDINKFGTVTGEHLEESEDVNNPLRKKN